MGIGRNPLREEMFSLNIDKKKKYKYLTYHIYYETDLMLEQLDQLKLDIIICYAAQGEGAVSWKNSWRFFETNSVVLTKLVEEFSKRNYLKNYQKLFCLLKKINIKLLELSISRDKIPDFNKFKYLS